MTDTRAESLRRSLSETTRLSLVDLEFFEEIGSTSTYLLGCENPLPGMMRVAIAAHQIGGRGRRDNIWHSPAGAGLWMSLAYSFTASPTHPPALTLAIGATLADEMVRLGIRDIKLKWPNDLMVDDRKLGGILLESSGRAMTVVAGVGINVKLASDADSAATKGYAPTDLSRHLSSAITIDELAVRVIERMREALQEYDARGIESFTSDWTRFDWLKGKQVVIGRAGHEDTGIADGISDDGALLLRTKDGLQTIVSGTVRVVDHQEAVA